MNTETMHPRDWAPFTIIAGEHHAPPPRKIDTPDGIADRLRAAAFAEIQAREAFLWAAERFTDAPESLRTAWRQLAKAEDKHLSWLLKRMTELGIAVADRPVSLKLWDSFMSTKTAQEFAWYMATAEDRGRQAGERFAQALKQVDPISAEIFRKIAEEEIEHIELAKKFYPERPKSSLKN